MGIHSRAWSKRAGAAVVLASVALVLVADAASAYHQSRSFPGCRDGRTFPTDAQDGRWTLIPYPTEDQVAIADYAVNPEQPNVIFVANARGGLFYTGDGGCDWIEMGPLPATAGARPDVIQIVLPASRPRNAVWLLLHDAATSTSTVVTSDSYGNEWNEPVVVSRVGTPTELLQAPSDPKRMYVAVDVPVQQDVASDVPGPLDRTIFYETTDGGKTWEMTRPLPDVAADVAANAPVAHFADADVDPARPDVLWAVDNSNVYRSADGAATWEKVDAFRVVDGKPKIPAVVEVDRGGRVAVFFHAAVDNGLAYSPNGGRSWSQYPTPGAATSASFRGEKVVFASDRGVFEGSPGQRWTTLRRGEETIFTPPLDTISVADDPGKTIFGIPGATGDVNPFDVVGFNPFPAPASNLQDFTG